MPAHAWAHRRVWTEIVSVRQQPNAKGIPNIGENWGVVGGDVRSGISGGLEKDRAGRRRLWEAILDCAQKSRKASLSMEQCTFDPLLSFLYNFSRLD